MFVNHEIYAMKTVISDTWNMVNVIRQERIDTPRTFTDLLSFSPKLMSIRRISVATVINHYSNWILWLKSIFRKQAARNRHSLKSVLIFRRYACKHESASD